MLARGIDRDLLQGFGHIVGHEHFHRSGNVQGADGGRGEGELADELAGLRNVDLFQTSCPGKSPVADCRNTVRQDNFLQVLLFSEGITADHQYRGRNHKALVGFSRRIEQQCRHILVIDHLVLYGDIGVALREFDLRDILAAIGGHAEAGQSRGEADRFQIGAGKDRVGLYILNALAEGDGADAVQLKLGTVERILTDVTNPIAVKGGGNDDIDPGA